MQQTSKFQVSTKLRMSARITLSCFLCVACTSKKRSQRRLCWFVALCSVAPPSANSTYPAIASSLRRPLSSLPPAQAHGWSKTNNIKPCTCKSWISVILTAKLPLTQICQIPHHFPCLLFQICNLCLSKARHLCPGFQCPCYHSVEDPRRWQSVVGKTWKNYHYKWLPSSSPRGCLVALSQWLLNVPPAHQCSFLDLFIEKTTRSIFKSSMVFEQGISMASICQRRQAL